MELHACKSAGFWGSFADLKVEVVREHWGSGIQRLYLLQIEWQDWIWRARVLWMLMMVLW
jgi:hypothetical protein